MDSTKIFIDTDNEITFVIEKILSGRTEKVILVIPDRASLLSSITGLKLIRRVLDKSNKLLIVVTLDVMGAQLCKKAGLCVVSRVGEITEDLWESVSKAKFEAIKKNSRPHYVPNIIKDELEGHKLSNADEIKSSTIDLKSLLKDENLEDDNEPEVIEEESESVEEIQAVETIDLKKAAVPEVRINVESIDLEEEPEAQMPQVEKEEHVPMFLAKEAPESEIKEHHISKEKKVELIPEPEEKIEEMPKEINTNTRVRKKAPSSSGIANLSFAVGKDIGQKKN
jgi:hypothetical protein